MKDGFVRVAVGTPHIRVAECDRNTEEVIRMMNGANAMKAKILALPELCLTGYTAGDLFMQTLLRKSALEALEKVVKASRGNDLLTLVGVPLVVDDRLYNCAAAVQGGAILGVIPKRNLPGYGEFHDPRYFTPGEGTVRMIELLGKTVPFGGDILFCCAEMSELKVGVEICEDLWAPIQPSTGHALAGATLMVNLSARNEVIGRAAYREMLLKSQSARLVAGYLYAEAGRGESTTDMVFAGHSHIAENGVILAATKRYECEMVTADLDVGYLAAERLRLNTFGGASCTHTRVPFHLKMEKLALDRFVDPSPFVPFNEKRRGRRCEDVLDIQVHGLMGRLSHTGCKNVVIGVSGGLDSTLAMIVAARAFERLGLDKKNITAVTMPCFGTTRRTYENAQKLAAGLGATLIEVPIGDSVRQHFKDIGHSEDVLDVTYENSQARERTQVLMDLANEKGAMVIGTGDLSELALGWATYNGDHMSMYGVNSGVPKTLVRHLVSYAAKMTEDPTLKEALEDVLDTPVSPELLPPKDGVISQVTEELVGPYELHDFFLYHLVRRMETPAKTRRLALIAFEGIYPEQVIDKWLETFVRRFFSQQFKRSCLPDGPKVGSVSLSPRGDWHMASDISWRMWQKSLEKNA